MDTSLERIIRQALKDARAAGKDYLTQTELAVRAVVNARPDLTSSDALTAVRRFQHSELSVLTYPQTGARIATAMTTDLDNQLLSKVDQIRQDIVIFCCLGSLREVPQQ